jgi:hypothetical protein
MLSRIIDSRKRPRSSTETIVFGGLLMQITSLIGAEIGLINPLLQYWAYLQAAIQRSIGLMMII